MRFLILIITLLTAISCSDDIIIAPGEFRGELTGAIEKKLVAEAFFLVVSDTTKNEEELSLNFITGQIENPGPEASPIYTGIFLQVPWDNQTGVLNFEHSGFSTYSVVYPGKALEYKSGKITIEGFNEDQIEGAISIIMIDNNSSEIDKEVNITGKFIALSGSSSTN